MSDWDWEDELEEDWPAWEGPRIVCRCNQVSEEEIEALIAQGADLEEIARRTGATTHCSGCSSVVRMMLAGE